jgi:hypothetical protein
VGPGRREEYRASNVTDASLLELQLDSSFTNNIDLVYIKNEWLSLPIPQLEWFPL